MENWPILCAEMAFKYPTLNRLDLTGAMSKDCFAFSKPGSSTTRLKELNLNNCDITPEDLSCAQALVHLL